MTGPLMAALIATMLVAFPASAAAEGSRRVSVASGGAQGDGLSGDPAVSADGRYVAFSSFAANMVIGDTNGQSDVFVHDRHTGTTDRVSVASDGRQADGFSANPAISADGRSVVFESGAPDLVAGDTNGQIDVFVHDRDSGTTDRVSVASGGTQANQFSSDPALSADGRFIAFSSLASNLTAGDTNAATDVFVHDRDTGETRRVSVASDGTQGDSNSGSAAISADGRSVAFSSFASNLAPGGADHVLGDPLVPVSDVFVHDRHTQLTSRVSVASDGTAGIHHSGEPAISADGRHVAFSSHAPNLVAGDTNDESDVFVHDRAAARTTRVSVASDGHQADQGSSGPAISAEGRHVAFSSEASTLVAGDTNAVYDVFVHDRAAARTTRVSVALDGAQADSDSGLPAVSAQGLHVAFESDASNLVAGDTNDHRDVFVAYQGPAGDCAGTPWEEVQRASFTDRQAIPAAHRFPVDCAAHHEIVRGFADDTYRPSLPVRRDQMATFVAGALRAAGVELPPATDQHFDDVPADSPHADAIHRLAAAGIVHGGPGATSSDHYGPALRVRRDQMASFLVRAAAHATGRTLETPTDAFADVPGDNVHVAAVNGAARHGLAQGFGDGTYRPDRDVPRDQMASFAARLLGFDRPYPGIDPASWTELDELQAGVDRGHQPWRLDPVAVARVFLADETAQWGRAITFDGTSAAVPYTLDGAPGLVTLGRTGGAGSVWYVAGHEPATG